jgi:flagella basal body P-ring formation protein FlgA
MLFVGAFLAASACAAPRATIELLSQATVPGPHLTLGQVARLHSDDLALIQQLVDLPVAVLPRPGDATLLARPALMQWSRRQGALADAWLDWTGADEIRVAREVHYARGRDIGDAALAGVREWLAGLGAPRHLVLASEPRDMEVPGGALRLQVRRQALALHRRRTTAWVDIWVGDVHVRAVPVSVELSSDAAFPWTGAGKLAIGAGSAPAMQRAAQGPERVRAAVGRGDWGALRVVSGAVALESRVEILQEGQPGETVRVRRATAGVVNARVVGPGQLEVAP